MYVNVSTHQFMSAGFTDSVADVLRATSTRPELLTLEVTESVLVRDQERAVVVLDQLADLGVNIALDDFGTGYSSLGYLDGLPIDTLKIDRTFIATLSHHAESQTIVTAIIQLAHSLGMTAVSEGVETIEQHQQVVGLGCDSCQGFYFARPMHATKLDRLLQYHADRSNPLLP